MAKRKGISPKLRFSILVRDGHKCRYCGASAVDSPLVVDHIIPVVQGGTNDPENLIAACQPCNAGKSAQTPSEAAPSPPDAQRIEAAVRDQATLADQIKTIAARREEWRQTICDFYCELRGTECMDAGTLTTFCRYAEIHGIATLFDWINIAHMRLYETATDTKFGRYVSGIRNRELEKAFVRSQQRSNA